MFRSLTCEPLPTAPAEYPAGAVSVKGIAKAYSVSKWTVYHLVGQKRKTLL